jgi:hypothetical protein
MDLCRRKKARWRRISHYDLSHGDNQGRETHMAQVKVFYDKQGNTLTVWFSDPKQEYICEETGEEVILMKDKSGRVIRFEKLNYSISETERLHVAFETVAA